MTRIRFVCLGNICRSPMAEGLFRARAHTRGVESAFEFDSCGTGGWHVGEQSDSRTRQTLAAHGIAFSHLARQLQDDDFSRFNLLLAMDSSNLDGMRSRCPLEYRDRLDLVLGPLGGDDLPDPYYGRGDGFEHVYELLDRATDAWLDRLAP